MSEYLTVTTIVTVDEHGEPTWIVTATGNGRPVIGQGPTLELASLDLVRKLRRPAVASNA